MALGDQVHAPYQLLCDWTPASPPVPPSPWLPAVATSGSLLVPLPGVLSLALLLTWVMLKSRLPGGHPTLPLGPSVLPWASLAVRGHLVSLFRYPPSRL